MGARAHTVLDSAITTENFKINPYFDICIMILYQSINFEWCYHYIYNIYQIMYIYLNCSTGDPGIAHRPCMACHGPIDHALHPRIARASNRGAARRGAEWWNITSRLLPRVGSKSDPPNSEIGQMGSISTGHRFRTHLADFRVGRFFSEVCDSHSCYPENYTANHWFGLKAGPSDTGYYLGYI